MTDDEYQEVDEDIDMLFVACQSRGGPFDGDAFVGGFICGVVDTLLPILKPHGCVLEKIVDPRIVPQLDLTAMLYGYTMTSEPWEEEPDEFMLVTFYPVVEDPHGSLDLSVDL